MDPQIFVRDSDLLCVPCCSRGKFMISPGKESLGIRRARVVRAAHRLPNRYFPKIHVGCPCLLNELLQPRYSSQSSVSLRPPLWIFGSKNRWPSAQPDNFYLAPLEPMKCPPPPPPRREREDLALLLQENYKLSTKTLWNMHERTI